MNQRARTELEEILSAEEFERQAPKPPPEWAGRILRHLPGSMRWMGALFELLLYLAAVLAIVFLCVFVARRFQRSPSATVNYSIPAESDHKIDPESAKSQAQDFFQNGEYRQAIRYLYLSLLLHLDAAELLKYDAAKTNGEYLREIRVSMSGKAEKFASLTRFFEQKWYGMEDSNAGDFQQCEEIFVELVSL